MSHADSGGDESIGTRCEHCGKLFIEEVSKSIHEHQCDAASDGAGDGGGTEDSARLKVPSDDNEEYDPLRAWLAEATRSGAVQFKGRYISDEVGLSPQQIGNFMRGIKQQDSAFEVAEIGRSSAIMWEVRQA